MNKIFNWFIENSGKILITTFIVLILSFNFRFIESIKSDISNLQDTITMEQIVQGKHYQVLGQGLMIVITQLEEVIKSSQFIIDQNRTHSVSGQNAETSSSSIKKPSYEELKSHTVFVIGCSDEENMDETLSKLTSDGQQCWSGTGVVIKVTDTETFILTNNHVAGKNEKNVTLFIDDDYTKIPAEVVKYHSYVDAAVIKINAILTDKVGIPGIASVNIQDAVYVVGNPLGVKYIYSEGCVAGYEDSSMLLQMPLIFGNSGSGVFDKNGNLVGLVYALESYRGVSSLEARITHSLVVDSISIKVFLQDLGLVD